MKALDNDKDVCHFVVEHSNTCLLSGCVPSALCQSSKCTEPWVAKCSEGVLR